MASFIQGKRGTATDSQAQANALIAQLAELKRLKQADEAEKRMVTDLESTMKHRDLGQENSVRGMGQKDRELEQADVELLREAEALKLQQAAEARFQASQDAKLKEAARQRALSGALLQLSTGEASPVRASPAPASTHPARSMGALASGPTAEIERVTGKKIAAPSAPASQAKADASATQTVDEATQKIDSMKPADVFSEGSMKLYRDAAKKAAAADPSATEGQYLEYLLDYAMQQSKAAAYSKQVDSSGEKASDANAQKERADIIKVQGRANEVASTFGKTSASEWATKLSGNASGTINVGGVVMTIPPDMLAQFKRGGYKPTSNLLGYIQEQAFNKMIDEAGLREAVNRNKDLAKQAQPGQPRAPTKPKTKQAPKASGATISKDLDTYESKKGSLDPATAEKLKYLMGK